jgi:hypothetical protein
VLAVVVVIDVVPANAPPDQTQVMVEACTSGVTQGTCALAADTPESARPSAVALVVWQGAAFLEATVRVGQRNGEWVSRQLAFAAGDPDRDRWVTVGLTVASLLDESRSNAPVNPGATVSAAPPASPAPPPPPPLATSQPQAQPPPIKGEQRDAQLGIGAGVLFGKGWDAGAPMTGAWTALTLSLFQRRFIGLAGGTLAFSSGPFLPGGGQLSSRWLALEAGFGPQATIAPFRFFVVPEIALQSVRADLGSGDSRSDQELELKLRAGAVWEATNHWGLSLGAATRLLPIESPSGDPTLARRSGFAGEILAGIELRP